MPNYRRVRIDGGTYFFTVVSYRRRPVLCNEDIRGALREGIRIVQADKPFNVDAWVLLPDHLHCIWTLPPEDSDFTTRWSMIKRFVTKACGSNYVGCVPRTDPPITVSQSRRKRNEGLVWQRRFWEHVVRDDDDYKRCIDYLHWNPVKHGHVDRAADWPFSRFHRYVRRGIYEPGWGGTGVIDTGDFGE